MTKGKRYFASFVGLDRARRSGPFSFLEFEGETVTQSREPVRGDAAIGRTNRIAKGLRSLVAISAGWVASQIHAESQKQRLSAGLREADVSHAPVEASTFDAGSNQATSITE